MTELLPKYPAEKYGDPDALSNSLDAKFRLVERHGKEEKENIEKVLAEVKDKVDGELFDRLVDAIQRFGFIQMVVTNVLSFEEFMKSGKRLEQLYEAEAKGKFNWRAN